MIGSLVAFSRAVMAGEELPHIEPTVRFGPDGAHLEVKASPEPHGARLWYAENGVRDFRDVAWEERPLEWTGEAFSAAIGRPARGWCAFFAELVFEIADRRLYLSTPAFVYP